MRTGTSKTWNCKLQHKGLRNQPHNPKEETKMKFYLRYLTKGGRGKYKYFRTESAMMAFILKSGCTVIERRELTEEE